MFNGLTKKIRRRTMVAGIFPDQEDYIRLATIRLKEYSEDWLVTVTKAYMNKA